MLSSQINLPWGESELSFAGGLRGQPLEVFPGPTTGVLIPPRAEIAIKGEVPPPDVESHLEGPLGEWPGYYSGGASEPASSYQPVIRVKRLYHRDAPILNDESPMWPGSPNRGFSALRASLLLVQLEKMGVPAVVGVHIEATMYFVVVAIDQQYAGHAKQAGLAAVSCGAAARHGRYVVVVDSDIDPTNFQEELWAMETRVDPASDIDIISGTWSTPLDPRMSPEQRDSRDYTNSRAIFYATRPFYWKDEFPVVSRTPRRLRDDVVQRFASQLPFRSAMPRMSVQQDWRAVNVDMETDGRATSTMRYREFDVLFGLEHIGENPVGTQA